MKLANAHRTLVAVAAALPLGAQDRHIEAYTPHRWVANADVAQIEALKAGGYRMIDVHVTATSPYRATASFVENAGPYRRSWWFYPAVNEAAIERLARQHAARPTALSAYTSSSGLLYSVILEDNSGANAKRWWLRSSASSTELETWLRTEGRRPFFVESLEQPGRRYVTALAVCDTLPWSWHFGASSDLLRSKLRVGNRRFLTLQRVGRDRYNALLGPGDGKQEFDFRATADEVARWNDRRPARVYDACAYVEDRRTYYTVLYARNLRSHLPFGSGCDAGNGKVLRHTTSGEPRPGKPVYLELANGEAGAIVQPILGLDNLRFGGARLPYDLSWLGMPGCALEISHDLRLPPVQANLNGSVKLAFPIPAIAALAGSVWHSQLLHQSVRTARVATSNGSRFEVLPASRLTVEESLRRLGVGNVSSPGKRLADDSEAYPDTYHPLGYAATWELSRRVELLTAGMRLANRPNDAATVVDDMLVSSKDPRGYVVPKLLATRAPQDLAWLDHSTDETFHPRSHRAMASGDVDGDGLDEVVAVYRKGRDVRLRVIDDTKYRRPDFETSLWSGASDRTHLDAGTGDVDGDGADELIVGIVDPTSARILVFDVHCGRVRLITSKNIARQLSGSSLSLDFAAGNLDHDRGEELAVALNEIKGRFPGSTLSARLLVCDDAGRQLATLREGPIEARLDQRVKRAVIADVAIGDIDGDNLGEIAIGGLTRLKTECAGSTELVMLALDDNVHSMASLGAAFREVGYGNCEDHDWQIVRWVHVNTLDVDGDRRAEVQVNHLVFEDWESATPWTETMRLPTEEFLPDRHVFSGPRHYDRSTTAIAVGDFTGDGRDDIALHRQGTFARDHRSPRGGEIGIYGKPPTPGQPLKQGTILTGDDASTRAHYPILLCPQMDNDSIRLRYSNGEHKVVFTRPIVIAALAAAPGSEGIGQRTDACITAFGNVTSKSTSKEHTVTITSSNIVGFKVSSDILQSEFSFKAKLSTAVTEIKSKAYELSHSRTFESGPLEDNVVFATLPVDLYSYEIASHPDPQYVGRKVVVGLPRNPVVIGVEREYYNRNTPASALKIGRNVFSHTAGDHRSYKTAAEKNLVVSRHPGALQSRNTIDVGQGAGADYTEIVVGESVGKGQSLDMSFEFEVEATGGTVLSGFTWGGGAGSTMMVTSGKSTIYQSSIGRIDAKNHADHAYSVGMFTYVYRDPRTSQKLHVLDYWVRLPRR